MNVGEMVMTAQRQARQIAEARAGWIVIDGNSHEEVVRAGAALILSQCLLLTHGHEEFEITRDEEVLAISLQYVLIGGFIIFALNEGMLCARVAFGGRRIGCELFFRKSWREIFNDRAQSDVMRYGVENANRVDVDLERAIGYVSQVFGRPAVINYEPVRAWRNTCIGFDGRPNSEVWKNAVIDFPLRSRNQTPIYVLQ